MIPTKNDFYMATKKANGVKVEYARVAAFSYHGEPLLQFTGESTVSQKVYMKMNHYTNPQIGDRVLVLNNIIMGTWS